MKRWRLMEEFENVAKNQPMFVGDAIGKSMIKELSRGEAPLVCRNDDGDVILTPEGGVVWRIWSRMPQEFYC
jgi:hypothetical protein